MFMRLAKCAAVACAVALAACTGPAGDVDVLQGERAIAPGAGLAWAPVPQDEMQNGDPRIDNDIIRQRVRNAVETALAARGHRFVQDPRDARYIVSYHVGLQNRQDYRIDTMAPPSGAVCGWRGCVGGFGWGMYGAPRGIRSVDYVEGVMILDLVDRSSGRLAWRATSQRRVDEGDGSQERLNAAVADMVRTLP
jgi:hypothetical protein